MCSAMGRTSVFADRCGTSEGFARLAKTPKNDKIRRQIAAPQLFERDARTELEIFDCGGSLAVKLVASARSRPPLGDSIGVPGRTGPRQGGAWASPGATRGHCEALLGRLWGVLGGSRGYRGRCWAIPARCCVDFWYDFRRISSLLHASESMRSASATASAKLDWPTARQAI